MQAQWADWVDELKEDYREPTFDELTQFIASRARVANSRQGHKVNECKLAKRCSVNGCEKKHHSLLHSENGKSVSVEDKAAIRIKEGSTRFENGHFAVPVPWKVNSNMKGRNYEVANNRLQSLKRRLLKDDTLYIKYTKEAVAISADVEEMFMQVKVPESDRGALRFLWWQEGDMSREPSEFQVTSHPFGATSSPFCANFALNKTAQIFSDGYDGYVVDAVKNNFYVDDCLVLREN
ncbi:unnamed protein product [Schistosoma mattheei]|uniref:Uncharacterized protein n=1 Tax=Schistosoma mattheei TaxID=31246 RepID=A0A183PQN1_9TREM|nr:unnamed protein product [Schistosoma mattheei]